MNLDDAQNLAEGLLRQHLPNQGWTFRFDDGIRRFGKCSYRTKTISLSKRLTLANSVNEVTNTITHEIAHALCGPDHGHDLIWSRTHRSLGGDGRARYSALQVQTVSRTTTFRMKP